MISRHPKKAENGLKDGELLPEMVDLLRLHDKTKGQHQNQNQSNRVPEFPWRHLPTPEEAFRDEIPHAVKAEQRVRKSEETGRRGER